MKLLPTGNHLYFFSIHLCLVSEVSSSLAIKLLCAEKKANIMILLLCEFFSPVGMMNRALQFWSNIGVVNTTHFHLFISSLFLGLFNYILIILIIFSLKYLQFLIIQRSDVGRFETFTRKSKVWSR